MQKLNVTAPFLSLQKNYLFAALYSLGDIPIDLLNILEK